MGVDTRWKSAKNVTGTAMLLSLVRVVMVVAILIASHVVVQAGRNVFFVQAQV